MNTIISFLNIPMPMPLWFCVAIFIALAWSLIKHFVAKEELRESDRAYLRQQDEIKVLKSDNTFWITKIVEIIEAHEAGDDLDQLIDAAKWHFTIIDFRCEHDGDAQ